LLASNELDSAPVRRGSEQPIVRPSPGAVEIPARGWAGWFPRSLRAKRLTLLWAFLLHRRRQKMAMEELSRTFAERRRLRDAEFLREQG